MPPGVGYNQSGVPLSPPGALSQRTDMQPQGADFGMGAGTEVLPTDQTMKQDMKMIGKYLPVFENMSSNENIPESFRLFVRYLRSNQ